MMEWYEDRWYAGSIGALAAIIVIGVAALVMGGRPGSSEATPGSTPTAGTTATATPAPDRATADFARALDLLAARDALAAYFDEHGEYPSTRGTFETLCGERDDAACALSPYTDRLPSGDGTEPYWYASDGASYSLVARAELEQPDGQDCPEELPESLADGHVMCMTGRGE